MDTPADDPAPVPAGPEAEGPGAGSPEDGDPTGGVPAQAPTVQDVLDRFAQEPVADSTRRVYRRHWRAFAEWCAAEGRPALPATSETVRAYAIAEGARGLSPSTIRGRLAAVRFVHRAEGEPDPTAGREVENTVKNLTRQVEAPPEPKKALSSDDVADMVRALPGAPSDGGASEEGTGGTPAGSPEARRLRGVRDRALILVGYAAALRRSELAGMTPAHLTFDSEGFEVFIPKSKGDQEGEGQTVAVRRGQSVDLCPKRALQRWIEAAGIEAGPVFRRVRNDGTFAPDGRAKPLSGQAVADAIKRAAKGAGLDPEKVSGHSLRRGHITTAARNGADLAALQRQARHEDPKTTAEYIEDARRMETSTSQHLGL
jgi:integrase